MFNNKYCKIINKFTKKVIAAGIVVNYKSIPSQCVSFDNKHFFNLKGSLLYKVVPVDYTEEVKFDNVKYKNKIKPWLYSIKNKHHFIFRENDITELDEEIKDLVYALNNIGFRTIGSCCGHGINVAWVDIEFYDFNQIKRLIDILNIKDFNNKFLLSTSDSLVNDKQNAIDLRLKSVKIGKEAYKDIKEFSKYLNVMN